ncbi:MAG: hypothetical protein ACRDV9_05090 [Acidimicrobiia bacterium]
MRAVPPLNGAVDSVAHEPASVGKRAVATRGPQAGHLFQVDTLDLYSARARTVFVRQAADELFVKEETVKRDLSRVLLACESAAEEAVRSAQEPEDTTVHLSAEEEAAALELLRDPHLVERVRRRSNRQP